MAPKSSTKNHNQKYAAPSYHSNSGPDAKNLPKPSSVFTATNIVHHNSSSVQFRTSIVQTRSRQTASQTISSGTPINNHVIKAILKRDKVESSPSEKVLPKASVPNTDQSCHRFVQMLSSKKIAKKMINTQSSHISNGHLKESKNHSNENQIDKHSECKSNSQCNKQTSKGTSVELQRTTEKQIESHICSMLGIVKK